MTSSGGPNPCTPFQRLPINGSPNRIHLPPKWPLTTKNGQNTTNMDTLPPNGLLPPNRMIPAPNETHVSPIRHNLEPKRPLCTNKGYVIAKKDKHQLYGYFNTNADTVTKADTVAHTAGHAVRRPHPRWCQRPESEEELAGRPSERLVPLYKSRPASRRAGVVRHQRGGCLSVPGGPLGRGTLGAVLSPHRSTSHR